MGDFFQNALYGYRTETNKQHRYSRFAATAYESNESKRKDLLNMREHQGFAYDTDLSNEKATVYHNVISNQTVVSFKGTDLADSSDLKTDYNILRNNKENDLQFIETEKLFERVLDKYSNTHVVTTGHSKGGSQALWLAERHNLESHTFNAAIDFDTVFNGNNVQLTETQYIYRNHLDPISLNAEVISGMNQANRVVKRVHNHSNHHSHSLENFYSDDAVRDTSTSHYKIKKEHVGETLERHRRIFTRVSTAFEDANDVSAYLDQVNKTPNVFVKGASALPQAISMARRNTGPQEYKHNVSNLLNPLPLGINLDVEYSWNDSEVITPLYRLGQILRTDSRKKTDKLLDLPNKFGERSNKHTEEIYYQVANSKPPPAIQSTSTEIQPTVTSSDLVDKLNFKAKTQPKCHNSCELYLTF